MDLDQGLTHVPVPTLMQVHINLHGCTGFLPVVHAKRGHTPGGPPFAQKYRHGLQVDLFLLPQMEIVIKGVVMRVNSPTLSIKVACEQLDRLLRESHKLGSSLATALVSRPGRVFQAATVPIVECKGDDLRDACSGFKQQTHHTLLTQPPGVPLFPLCPPLIVEE